MQILKRSFSKLGFPLLVILASCEPIVSFGPPAAGGGAGGAANVGGSGGDGGQVVSSSSSSSASSSSSSASSSSSSSGMGGNFAPKLDYSVFGTQTTVSTADVNEDGFPDLLIQNAQTQAIGIALNQGNGTFGARIDKTMPGSTGMFTPVDIKGDGDLDLVLAQGNQTIGVARNLGNLNFAPTTNVANGVSTSGFVAADLTQRIPHYIP